VTSKNQKWHPEHPRGAGPARNDQGTYRNWFKLILTNNSGK